jgi:hypothetical protein
LTRRRRRIPAMPKGKMGVGFGDHKKYVLKPPTIPFLSLFDACQLYSRLKRVFGKFSIIIIFLLLLLLSREGEKDTYIRTYCLQERTIKFFPSKGIIEEVLYVKPGKFTRSIIK